MISVGRRRMLALKIAITLVAAVGVLDFRNPVSAQGRRPAPWCAYLGGHGGGFDCGYYTFEQCMATARGLGGSCSPNPRAVHEPVQTPRRDRK